MPGPVGRRTPACSPSGRKESTGAPLASASALPHSKSHGPMAVPLQFRGHGGLIVFRFEVERR